MRQRYPQNWLIQVATKALKYFLLSLASCTLTYVVSIFLQFGLLANIMVAILEHVLARVFVLVVCLVVIAVITESLKN